MKQLECDPTLEAIKMRVNGEYAEYQELSPFVKGFRTGLRESGPELARFFTLLIKIGGALLVIKIIAESNVEVLQDYDVFPEWSRRKELIVGGVAYFVGRRVGIHFSPLEVLKRDILHIIESAEEKKADKK